MVARWAHNPKVAGSSPAPAPKLKTQPEAGSFLFTSYLAHQFPANSIHAQADAGSFEPGRAILTAR
jgi:hypothetical protein